MSTQDQLAMVVNAVMTGAKTGKMPLLTAEGIVKFGELMKSEGKGFVVDFRSLNYNENIG